MEIPGSSAGLKRSLERTSRSKEKGNKFWSENGCISKNGGMGEGRKDVA
jgi:hypothetical protein